MQRRDFLKAGAAGMALTLAQGSAQAQVEPRADVKGADAKDTPEDLSVVVIGVDGSDLSPAYVDEYQRSGADVWQYSGNVMDDSRFQKLNDFVDSPSSKITMAKSYSDILAAKRAGKVAMVVGCQDCMVFERAAEGNDWSVNPPTTTLPHYYEKGLRIANLAYNLSNSLGGGCLDPTTPLNRESRFLIGQMQEIGILVDVSHSSEQTSLDIIGMARRPVVVSHSNCQTLNDNPRNVSDRVIEGMAKTGGLIGVCPVDVFITWSRKDAPYAETGPFPPQATISRYVDIIDYLRRLVGIDHIGIGTDFTVPSGSTANFIPPPPSKSFLYPPEMGFNQPKGLRYVEGFDRVGGLPNVRAELERRGYTPEEMAKILGGNWMRVFREAWNA